MSSASTIARGQRASCRAGRDDIPVERRSDELRVLGAGQEVDVACASPLRASSVNGAHPIEGADSCLWTRRLNQPRRPCRRRARVCVDGQSHRLRRSGWRRGPRAVDAGPRWLAPDATESDSHARELVPHWCLSVPQERENPHYNAGFQAMGDTGLEPVTSALSRRRSPS